MIISTKIAPKPYINTKQNIETLASKYRSSGSYIRVIDYSSYWTSKQYYTDQFQFSYDNSRSPSVGSIRQGARFTQGNLLGFGDSLQLSFGRSQGSEDWDVLYTLPLGPYDTTLTFNVGASTGEILDEIFSALDIISATRYTDITLRHPLYLTPTDEFALRLGLSHTETQSTILGGQGITRKRGER